MRAFSALVHREFLEHRGVFLVAPLVLLGLLLLAALYVTVTAHVRIDFWTSGEISFLSFYETLYASAAMAWWTYLLISLFFYFSDAFSADSRDNAMLFWKSMPQSDLKILAAKSAAALTVFPAAVFLALLLTGLLAYLPGAATGGALPGYAPPGPADALSAWAGISLASLAYFFLGILWYAPFLAWVGLLSTVFKRWSIPLAILIPVVIGLAETALLRDPAAPKGGRLLAFLGDRIQFEFGGVDFWWFSLPSAAGGPASLLTDMVARTDWLSLCLGLVVAALFVFGASEYRRRLVLT